MPNLAPPPISPTNCPMVPLFVGLMGGQTNAARLPDRKRGLVVITCNYAITRCRWRATLWNHGRSLAAGAVAALTLAAGGGGEPRAEPAQRRTLLLGLPKLNLSKELYGRIKLGKY